MAPANHAEAMSVLLESAEFSDLILACQDQEFLVHRAIVCPHSAFFSKSCSGDFKEASSKRIELKEDDPATVKRMVSYMYTFDYEDEKNQSLKSDDRSSVSPEEGEEAVEITSVKSDIVSDHNENQPALVSSVRVYAIADKYGIPPLKELARQRFCDWAETNWLHEDFCSIAQEIFSSTPHNDRGLRDVVVQIVAMHANDLIQKDEFRSLVEEVGDLGLGILCQVLKQHSEKVLDLDSRIEELEAETEMLKAQVEEREQKLSRQTSETELMRPLAACIRKIIAAAKWSRSYHQNATRYKGFRYPEQGIDRDDGGLRFQDDETYLWSTAKAPPSVSWGTILQALFETDGQPQKHTPPHHRDHPRRTRIDVREEQGLLYDVLVRGLSLYFGLDFRGNFDRDRDFAELEGLSPDI
ncbi:hypothetical protein AYO20_02648 [Fonsecaea nubica]|uniref:BTB domain-containing protein n=1 Tax=Fonsecaea nubica TaxID=856822 RepID=A0A178D8W7_9EURO|nr:hypothetical protein AYO20_02648 [Fonsecaea nubica]OAL38196.1 hypothetical protein AYO20_02648 [Fonsecaea nubica]